MGKLIFTSLFFLFWCSSGYCQDLMIDKVKKEYRHAIEVFPIVAIAKIYSLQYLYEITPKSELILGFSYLNISVENRDGEKIGRLYSPTLPIGFRRYFWRNSHLEYQLWPAYNKYLEIQENKFYKGFDLYNEFRIGYKFDFSIGSFPLLANFQYVYGFGLFPGNKPDSFLEVNKENPVFHIPSLAVGIRF